jgi:Domain of unknown function (DUF4123)
MMPIAEQVLRALPATLPVYAVLDGARDPRVRGFALDSGMPACCLYRGALPAELEDAAPWLLRLVPGHASTARFFARGWGDCWGVVLASAAPWRELRRHLRRFLVARTESGRKLLFRHYDPRVLRAYLPSCTREELCAFAGPIAAFATPARDPAGFELFQRPAASAETRLSEPPATGTVESQPRPPRRLILRDSQLAALARVPREAFEDRAVAHVQRHFREAGPVEAVRAHVRQAVDRALLHGLRAESALLQFIDVTLALGLTFDEAAGAQWARAYLLDEEVTEPDARMRRLHAELIRRTAVEERNAAVLEEWNHG